MLASHCLPTWAVLLPHLRSPCSSITNTPFSVGAIVSSSNELQPAFVDLPRVPTGLRQEPLQALRFFSLRPGHRLSVGEGGKRLVALGRKQESFEITTEALALSPSSEEIIEASGVVLQWAGSGSHGQSSGHGSTSYRHWSTPSALLQQTTGRATPPAAAKRVSFKILDMGFRERFFSEAR